MGFNFLQLSKILSGVLVLFFSSFLYADGLEKCINEIRNDYPLGLHNVRFLKCNNMGNIDSLRPLLGFPMLQELEMKNNNIKSSKYFDKIFSLPSLKKVVFTYNNTNVQIPRKKYLVSWINNDYHFTETNNTFINLEYLDLSGNSFEGSGGFWVGDANLSDINATLFPAHKKVTSSLDLLKNMLELDGYYNSIFNKTSYPNLKTLRLTNTNFFGALPIIPSLEELYIQNNKVQGYIDINSTRLKKLRVSNNFLSGKIKITAPLQNATGLSVAKNNLLIDRISEQFIEQKSSFLGGLTKAKEKQKRSNIDIQNLIIAWYLTNDGSKQSYYFICHLLSSINEGKTKTVQQIWDESANPTKPCILGRGE